MSVRVLFFASLREAAGTGELTLALNDTVTLEELIRQLSGCLPPEGMTALQAENVRIAINQSLAAVEGTVRISPGDEVAFLPPVTGG